MPVEIGQELIEFHKKKSNLTDEQGQFMLRIIKLVYQVFPNLDNLNRMFNCCTVLAQVIYVTTPYGMRSFYFKTPTTAYYYQYQRGRENDFHTEEPKEFSLFTDKEILTNLKRKQFPREKVLK